MINEGRRENMEVNCLSNNLMFSQPIEKKKNLNDIVGKAENAGYQHFLRLPECILHFQSLSSSFELKINYLNMKCYAMNLSKIWLPVIWHLSG